MRKLMTLCLCLYCVTAWAQFSGKGSGTAKDPFKITNADELFEVRNDPNANYILMNDVDLSDWLEENSPNYGWSPIGTETTPFNGTFDGNNKSIINLKIQRPSTNDIGLFGYSKSATLKNIVLVNPIIKGNENVGGICGRRYSSTSSEQTADAPISVINCHVIGGTIEGTKNVGGICGSIYSSATYGCPTSIISCNFNSADIKGTSNIGGICGSVEFIAGGQFHLTDSYSFAYVVGDTNVGGIAGYIHSGWSWLNNIDTGRPPFDIKCNATMGVVKGITNCNGIIGCNKVDDAWTGIWGSPKVYGEMTVSKNACIADTIYGDNRIGASNIKYSDNIAWIKTVVNSIHGELEVEDDLLNGVAYGESLLKKSTTYKGLTWDFNSNWKIDEGQTFPFHYSQTSIAHPGSFKAGSRGFIEGKEQISEGKVYVIIDGVCFSAPIIDNSWSLQLGNIKEGSIAKVFLQANNCIPSYPSIVSAIADIEIPVLTPGDANGDGVIDAADIVSIINYIIGKSSSSFNALNADVNGDGQVLVDDAVAAVELIMNAQ